jgi:hypothetical protein
MSTKRTAILTALTFLSLCEAPALALDLHVLNDCTKLRSLIQLTDKTVGLNPPCRPAADPIELRISQRFVFPNCFLEDPQVSGLQGFECFQTRSVREFGALDCFRVIELSELDDYKTNYVDGYAAKVSDYLLATKDCGATSGDAIQAPEMMLRGPIPTVAAQEFAFAVILGTSEAPTGTLIHGFARLDPKLASAGEALEFVSLWTGEQGRMPIQEIDWDTADKVRVVNIDEAEELKQVLGQQFVAQAAVPIYFDFLGFDLTAGHQHAHEVLDHDFRDEGLALLREVIAEDIEINGFEELDDDAFTTLVGVSPTGYSEFLSENILPFDIQDNLKMAKVSGFIRESVACSPQDGAIFVLLMGTITNNRPGDYGSVAALAMAIGKCLRDDKAVVEQLISDLRHNVKILVEE